LNRKKKQIILNLVVVSILKLKGYLIFLAYCSNFAFLLVFKVSFVLGGFNIFLFLAKTNEMN
jgi:hypothetical protein